MLVVLNLGGAWKIAIITNYRKLYLKSKCIQMNLLELKKWNSKWSLAFAMKFYKILLYLAMILLIKKTLFTYITSIDQFEGSSSGQKFVTRKKKYKNLILVSKF